MTTPLHIFPSISLAHSIITIVWVGVAVVAFFNLRLGWPIAGLVVPGYLVPILIAKPWAAAVTIVEGVATYFLAWVISGPPSRAGLWSGFFGRDRFFLLILLSVLVRAAFDGWVLPRVGTLLASQYGIVFDYHNNLHSFGLVIVALIGNNFWKTGFVRGLLPQAVVVTLTWAIVRFVLMRYTNFSLAQLEYMYEDIAFSFLASPKAYVVLLSGAYVASRMNLLYGWDYHGILVPSLLALAWPTPIKVLLTLGEALVILALSQIVLALPIFAGATIEKARKTLLFFSVGFLYKMALSFALMKWAPDVKASDTFAFGYMLSTLLAIKMHDDGVAPRVARVTLQCSLVAALVANLIGYGLTLLPRPWPIAVADRGPVPPPVVEKDARLDDVMRRDKVKLTTRRAADSVPTPTDAELAVFEAAVERLVRHIAHGSAEDLKIARELLWSLQYRVDELADRWLYVREVNPERGWGFFVFDRSSPKGPVVEVPAAADEWLAMDAAVVLFQLVGGSALAVAGAQRTVNANGASDALTADRTVFQSFHKTLARRNVLQVRGHTFETVQRLTGLREQATALEVPEVPSRMWVKAALPEGLDLSKLKALGDGLAIVWDEGAGRNVQRQCTPSGFAELVLSRADRRKLLVGSLLTTQAITPDEHVESIDGFLTKWLLDTRGEIAEPGSDKYVVPRRDHLLFMDDSVLTPLFRILRDKRKQPGLGDAEADLAVLNAFAGVFDYRLSRYLQKGSGREYVVVSERPDANPRRHWGTFVFRVGATRPFVVMVPRPRFEKGSFEYGVSLFEELRAEALFIAGANPRANRDGTADVVALHNRASLFNLVMQAFARENIGRTLMFVQARGYAVRPGVPAPEADAMLALADATVSETSLSGLAAELHKRLRDDRLLVKMVDGSPGTAGYEVTGTAQAQYVMEMTRHRFAALWLSPSIRATFRGQADNELQEAQFNALGIPTLQGELFGRIEALGTAPAAHRVPDELKKAIAVFTARQDVVALASVRERWPSFKLERVLDRDTQLTFLLVQTEPGRWPAVAALRPKPGAEAHVMLRPKPVRAQVRDWVTEHTGWMEFEP